MQAVAEILGMRLHTASKEMVAALLPLTTHKRHKVRRPATHGGCRGATCLCSSSLARVDVHRTPFELDVDMMPSL